MEIATKVIRQVYDDGGKYLTVQPWPESPSAVGLMSVGKENQEYWGDNEIVMSPEFARQLGKALIACADEIECNFKNSHSGR
jgi:hypothetical protein